MARGACAIRTYAIVSCALFLAACGVADCLPLPDSAARTELRVRLQRLVHRSQCPGPPTPSAFQAQELELSRETDALIGRVVRSRMAEDLARVTREDEEASRHVNESDCNMIFWGQPDAPANIAQWPGILDRRRAELRAAEAAFARVSAACQGD